MKERFEPSAAPGAWERHSRSLGFGVFVLALGVLAGAGARDASSREEAAWRQGKPQIVQVTAAQRDEQVQEMQAMLRGMQAVMNAADQMDVPKMRAAAQAVGMDAATRDQNLLNQLPKDYRARLINNHAAFDAMADAIRGFTAQDTVLTHLSKISQMCVSCHAAYKFELKQ